MRIFKYPIQLADAQELCLPKGAKILSIQFEFQTRVLTVWAIVDPEEINFDKYVIYVRGTGHIVQDHLIKEAEYFITLQDYHFVWHIFVEKL